MFCAKCGNQYDDAAAVCPNCGEPNPNAKPAAKSAGGFKLPGSLDPKLIGIAAVVVVALIALIVLFTGGHGSEKTVGKYVDALLEEDGEALIALFPPDLLEAYIELYDDEDLDRDDLADAYEDSLKNTMNNIEDTVGKIEKTTYEIEDLDELDEDDLEDLLDEYDDNYDVKLDAKAAVTVEIGVEVTGDDDDYEAEITLTLVKIGSKWYLLRGMLWP